MSTRSRRRAARRHPESNPATAQAVEAVGTALVTLLTLGALEEERAVESKRVPESEAQ